MKQQKRQPLHGKAKFQRLGQDLFWEFMEIDFDGGCKFVTVRWQGYDDPFWWLNVAPTREIAVGSNGRKYKIDFCTNDVVEVEE